MALTYLGLEGVVKDLQGKQMYNQSYWWNMEWYTSMNQREYEKLYSLVSFFHSAELHSREGTLFCLRLFLQH